MEEEIGMIECSTLEDFVRLNHTDIQKLFYVKFNNILREDFTLEDCTQSFYLHLSKTKAVEKFDPNNEWGAKFSTYMYRVMSNFSCLIHGGKHKKQYSATCSLDEIVFSNLSRMSSLPIEEICENSNLSFDLKQIYKKLVEYDETQKYAAKIKFSDLFKLYESGLTDSEISKKYEISTAAVGARKRILRQLVRDYYDPIL